VKPRRTRLLAPLAPDLAEFRIRCGRPGDDELVFDEWSASDWDNWRERIFRPATIEVGAPADTIPRDPSRQLRQSSDLRGLNVLEVAPELAHKPSTCLNIYGRLFEEFDPPGGSSARRGRPSAMESYPVRTRLAGERTAKPTALRRKVAPSSVFLESPLPDSNRRPLPYHGRCAAQQLRTPRHGTSALSRQNVTSIPPIGVRA
jgi:hypothetical protein